MVTSHLHHTSRRETRPKDTFTVIHDPDEPKLRAFLSALEREDWDGAWEELGKALTVEPFLIAHPDVMNVLQWYYDEPRNSQPYRVESISYLLRKFGEGLLPGVKITIDSEPKHLQGPRILLFPHLKEHQGRTSTIAARRELDEAWILLAFVDELSTLIKQSQPWRSIWREYHRYPRTRESTVTAIAQRTLEIFDQFKKRPYGTITGEPLNPAACCSIIRQAMVNKSTLDITYSLIASIPFACFRNAPGNKPTSALIKGAVNQLKEFFMQHPSLAPGGEQYRRMYNLDFPL